MGTDLAQLRDLLRQNRFSEVLSAAHAVLATAPDHRDALLFSAIARRFQGQVDQALQTLDCLEHHHPRFSRLHEERGRCFVALRQAQPAIEAFVRAVRINHALPGSWGMLEKLYRMQGDTLSAANAGREAATLRGLPQEVVVATGLFVDGDIEAAESLIRRYLLEHGDHIEAMRLLARIGIAHKVYFDAQVLLAAVLERTPDHRAAREEYAFVLIELHRHDEALAQIEKLLALEPDKRQLKILRAAALAGLGEHERAIGLYRGLLTGTSADSEAHLSIGHALKTLGQTAEAIESYRRAAACRPDFGDAYWSLANLKTYRFTPLEQARMQSALAAPTLAAVDRYHLSFALGKALEDEDNFAESFRHYQQGNELKRAECRYRAELIETNTKQQVQVCSSEFFAARRGWGNQAHDPIFIIGLPRSGSTLLEQILASHSQVEGTQELPNIQQIVSRLHGFGPEAAAPRYPRILADLSAEQCAQLGAEYLAGTRCYRRGKAGVATPFFIDKMPNNFRHVGLIHLILPNARIIDARREPMACCFSNFKQLFANGQEFTYSIEDIARYYRTYLELMRHWDDVLPGRVLRVHHEDVIEDLEGSVRRLLEYCNLEFEPQCIAFHRTHRSVRTASSEQVRQGLSRSGVDQWKHFEPWLGKLKDSLGDALTRYREDPTQGVAAHLHLAMTQRMRGMAAAAEASCRAALALAPDKPDALLLLGELHADRGRFAQAHELFERALAADARYVLAYNSIAANRRMSRNDTAWLQGVQALLDEPLPPKDEINLRKALGKYFDDIGEYDDAFAQHRTANELKKRYTPNYDRAHLKAQIDAIIRWCNAAPAMSGAAGPAQSDRPVFIIGMPRSGTSLTEQILASHPAVFGAGEVKFWSWAFARLEACTGSEELSACANSLIPEYLQRLTARAGGVSRIIDKMPANFLYAGVIHRLLPRARFIHMQRHPLDTCLSVYFQNFLRSTPYANDLSDIAHYYGEYLRIMSHWRSTLPKQVLLEVPYEELLTESEAWTRRMLAFIDLPWDSRCLEFHRTERVVLTASKWQVRQEITTASVGRWQHYDKHLAPLRHLLEVT